jgi:hypothetical protein
VIAGAATARGARAASLARTEGSLRQGIEEMVPRLDRASRPAPSGVANQADVVDA